MTIEKLILLLTLTTLDVLVKLTKNFTIDIKKTVI